MNQRDRLVRAIAAQHRDERGALMPVLHEINDELGHISVEDEAAVADVLNLSRADVHGVVGFYHDFRTTPRPEHRVQVCRAEACQAVGGEDLWERAGEAFADDTVAVEQVFCLGNCALGPSAMVDGRLHGRLTHERLAELTTGWGL